jgi:DNA-binding transcriptional ArsR family regulator
MRDTASVGVLADAVGLSQSALSQHLARLRADGLLATRRDAQTVFYRVADPNVGRILALLKAIYCPRHRRPDARPTLPHFNKGRSIKKRHPLPGTAA